MLCSLPPLQVSCILGLLYLTSVAGLIASSTVIHQLGRLPNTSHIYLDPMKQTSLQTPALFPEPLQDMQRPTSNLHCCVLTNDSLKPRPTAVPDQLGSTSSSHQNMVLCLRGSIISALSYSNPSSDIQPQDVSEVICHSHMGSFPQCAIAGNGSAPLSSPWFSRLTALWLGFAPFSESLIFSDPHLTSMPPFQRCCPETTVPFGKSPSLLMPG